MTFDLPRKVHLPSRRQVRLSMKSAVRAKAALGDRSEGPFGDALAILSAEGVLAMADGAPLDVYTLSLRDVHLLRALVVRADLVPEEVGSFTCENCEEPFDARPSQLLELGPFLDGELTDPELDADFPFGEPLPIPRIRIVPPRPLAQRRAVTRGRSRRGEAPEMVRQGPLRTPRVADTVTFAERTADEARRLFQAADALFSGRAKGLRLTPALTVAMGVTALGTERRASVIAQTLADAPENAWAAVVDHFHDAAYPRRLFAVKRCTACGARNDLDVPLARELDREPLAPEGALVKAHGEKPSFPDLDAFETLVSACADEVYSRRGVRNIDLFVDADVPHCDDAGEPLLGSYLPGGTDEDTGVSRAPEVRIYYRSFKAEYDRDPDFDVRGEIFETIDHEIEHHLNYLSGVDPLDDEELRVMEADRIRRIGAREAARREGQAFFADLTGFVRTTWPVWLVALVATIIALWAR